MAGAAVAVRDQDVAEAGAGERSPVVHHHVAHEPLPHRHRAHGVEREGAQVERGRQHDREARAARDDALGDGFREMARGECVDAERQVRPVGLERAHREDHHGALPVERVEPRRGELLQAMDGQKLLPRVARR